MACLDTALLIDLFGRGGRRRQTAAQVKLRTLQQSDELLTTTRLNVAELWVGVSRSRDPEAEAEVVHHLLAPLVILDFDEPAARIFGAIVADLQRRGRPIGDMDALIASVALAHAQKVVTRNLRHFAEIPGLEVESY